MKRFLLIGWFVCALVGCTNQPTYTITGTFAEEVPMAWLWDRDNNQIVDSVALVAGEFRFEGRYELPCELIVIDAGDVNKIRQQIMVLVEPGEIHAVPQPERKGRYQVTGTPANDTYTAYIDVQNSLMAELRREGTTEERQAELRKQMQDLEWKTIEENTHNLIAPLQLRTETYDLSADELMAWVERFTPEVQQSAAAQELIEVAELKRRTEVGQPYIDFELPNANGESVSLKSVIENPANKYVLIDFWASWCGPCMAEMPHLKEVYAAYHKKGFEIVGITHDFKREAWLGAIEKHGLNWIQLGEIGVYQNRAAELYGVQGIPTNYLFDCATGKIVGVNLRGEAVQEKVAELLQ